jgi:hypothetical protein
MNCDQCNMVRVNGVTIHESGCPNESTGKPIPCFNCGFSFIPDAPIVNPYTRAYAICPDCLNPVDADAEEYEDGAEEEEADE